MLGTLLAPTLALLAASSAQSLALGDVPEHTFQRAPLNGVLVRTLEDLRGRPVLFEFWGPRCPVCVQSGVPGALELQNRWADDLQVVLVECQGAGFDDAASFALGQRWLGGRAQWTSEVPFWPGGTTLPVFVLLGNEGQVLLMGNPLSQSRELDRLIAEQVRLRRAPPADAPESLRGAWDEYGRERLARALALARAAEAEVAGDPAALERVRAGTAVLRRRIDARFAAAAALLEAGLYEEAEARLDVLVPGVRDDAELSERAAAMVRRLEAVPEQVERDAARAFARLLERFQQSGGDAASLRELERFAELAAGTRAAQRAQEWIRLAPGRARARAAQPR